VALNIGGNAFRRNGAAEILDAVAVRAQQSHCAGS
jgi:hypothetical protein